MERIVSSSIKSQFETIQFDLYSTKSSAVILSMLRPAVLLKYLLPVTLLVYNSEYASKTVLVSHIISVCDHRVANSALFFVQNDCLGEGCHLFLASCGRE